MVKRRYKYGKRWTTRKGTFRYKYSGKYGQWKILQRRNADVTPQVWVDLWQGWRSSRRGEFRRKYQ